MPIKPVFDLRAILPVLVMFVVTAVETVGDISGVMEGGMQREATDKELSGGVMCDGIGSTLAALFGVLPNTSFSQNVGLVAMTKVVNRIALASGAVFLILCGLIPKLGALISGIPTPWARAKLFKFAFSTIAAPDPNINTEGLLQFYNMLHAEWKGLMAVIALYPDRIRFSDPVYMDVRGGDYDIASAFGRMLFNEKDVWSNQDDLARNPDAQPFIQLIYYREHLVGGTSPLTGCFTGVDYSNLGNDASDINWYRQGKFEDPMNYLTPEEKHEP